MSSAVYTAGSPARQAYMRAGVLVIPGSSTRRVTGQDQTIRIPRADISHPGNRSRNVRTGVDRLTVLALLGVCLIADGGALFLCGMMIR